MPKVSAIGTLTICLVFVCFILSPWLTVFGTLLGFLRLSLKRICLAGLFWIPILILVIGLTLATVLPTWDGILRPDRDLNPAAEASGLLMVAIGALSVFTAAASSVVISLVWWAFPVLVSMTATNYFLGLTFR